MPRRNPNSLDAHVGRRVRMARLGAGWSQERLAKALQISFQQVQKYEKGANRIGASRLSDIAAVLNVPIAYFFEDAPGAVTVENPQPGAVTVMLSTPEGQRVAQAFAAIEDPAMRLSVAIFLESMVRSQNRGGGEPQAS
jgi:transcriptional regulator with XRE-family HTH domain